MRPDLYARLAADATYRHSLALGTIQAITEDRGRTTAEQLAAIREVLATVSKLDDGKS